MKKQLYRHFPIAIFVLMGLAPFLWFSLKDVIYGPDTMWTINGVSQLAQTLSTWKSGVSFGYGWTDSGAALHNIYIDLLRYVGFSYPIVQRLIVGVLIFSSGYFIYLLFLEIVGETSRRTKTLAVAAGLIYILNPFAITWVWWRFLSVMYAYPTWPLFFLIVVKIFKGKATYPKLILLALLVSLFAPGVSAIILLLTLGLAVIVLAIIAVFIDKKLLNVDVAKRILFFLFVTGLLNFYWLLPGILMLNHSISNALTAYDPDAAFRYNSQFTSLIDTIRLWGATALHISFYDQKYFGTGIIEVIGSDAFKLVLFVPLAAIVVLFMNIKSLGRREKAFVFGFGLIAFIGIFMMKAGNAPLSLINSSIVHLPMGAAFRIPYDKFGYWPAIAFSILTPLAIYAVKHKAPRYILSSVVALYIIVPLAIFFTPNMFITEDKQSLKGVVAEMPTEYSKLSSLGLTSKDKVLVLPSAYHGESSFVWPRGVQANSHDILSNLVPAGIIFLPNGNPYSDNTKDVVTGELFSGLYTERTINQVLLGMGITHIFIHDDWNAGFMLSKEPLPDYYRPLVQSLPGVKLREKNNYYEMYELSKAPSRREELSNPNTILSTTDGSAGLGDITSVLDTYGVNAALTSVKQKTSLVRLSNPVVNGTSLKYTFSNDTNTARIVLNKSILASFTVPPTILVDGKKIQIGVLKQEQSQLSLNLNIPSGNHALEIKGLSKITVVDPSFDTVKSEIESDWECGNKFEENIKQAGSSTDPDGEYLELISGSGVASCHMLNISSVTPNANGFFSIRYRTRQANGARITVVENDAKGPAGETRVVVNKELPPSKNWTTISVHFLTSVGKEYRPFLYSGLSDGEPSTTDYDEVEAVSVPIGYGELFSVAEGDSAPPDSISTEARIEILPRQKETFRYFDFTPSTTNPIITLNTAFDPSWRAYIVRQGYKPTPLDEILGTIGVKLSGADHILVNGYANGWQIKNAEIGQPMRIVLEYTPQRWFYVGLLISVATLTGCLGYLAWTWKRRKSPPLAKKPLTPRP